LVFSLASRTRRGNGDWRGRWAQRSRAAAAFLEQVQKKEIIVCFGPCSTLRLERAARLGGRCGGKRARVTHGSPRGTAPKAPPAPASGRRRHGRAARLPCPRVQCGRARPPQRPFFSGNLTSRFLLLPRRPPSHTGFYGGAHREEHGAETKEGLLSQQTPNIERPAVRLARASTAPRRPSGGH